MLGQQLHYHCCQATASIVTTIASTSLGIRGAIPPLTASAINRNGASTSAILTACRAKPLAPPPLLGPSTIATGPLVIANGPLHHCRQPISLSRPSQVPQTPSAVPTYSVVVAAGASVLPPPLVMVPTSPHAGPMPLVPAPSRGCDCFLFFFACTGYQTRKSKKSTFS